MGLGASIHQSLTVFQRQHSETKSAKMVSKCYKKRGRRLYFSIDKMSIFYWSIHKILLLANMGGGSVLLFVFQRRFLDFYEKNYIVLKLRKNHSFRARVLSRKTSQTIPTLQHTFSHYWRKPAHRKKLGNASFTFIQKHPQLDWDFWHLLNTGYSLSSLWPLHGAVSLLCNAEQKMEDIDTMKVWHTKGLRNSLRLNSFYFDFKSHHSPLIKTALEIKLLWINFQKCRLNYCSAPFLKPLLSRHW